MPRTTLLIVDQLPSAGTGDSLWRDGSLQQFECQVVYETDRGVVIAPSAAADDANAPPPAPVKAHATYTIKHVIFNIQRVGAPPVLPDFETNDTNEVLLTSKINVGAPVMHDICGLVYFNSISGHYRYLMLKNPDKATGFKSAYCLYYEGARCKYTTPMFRKDIVDW